MEQFLKIGQLVLNQRHIESVGIDVEFQSRKVTFIRMNRQHQQQRQTPDGPVSKDVVVSYRFEGRAAQAVNLFFEGKLPMYAGFNGWLYDIAAGMRQYEAKNKATVPLEEAFAPTKHPLVALPPDEIVSPKTAGGSVVKLDLSKVRSKLSKDEKEKD